MQKGAANINIIAKTSNQGKVANPNLCNITHVESSTYLVPLQIEG